MHIGDVNLYTGAPVRTWYREQVRRIAPPELLDRAAELAELAAFCADPATRGCYSWWRAEAWAGKSALMSWFFLNPPSNVRLVSFFITARLASQNDRVAFGDNVIEQLAAILGLPVPQTSDSTRDAHLLGMLHEAAQRCRERGEDFVLIVDGLDEDRGVTMGRDAHSIAALLPMNLPVGMRVILTGRPHPPVPDDVPDHHPIRDPRIVRALSVAAEAKVVRADMLRELRTFLDGTADEKALLGFLTVAGGGLTTLDLAELTGKPGWRIEEYLRTVAGRSFTRRGGYWRPELSPEAYLLGHEELQKAAEDLFGPEQLGVYRGRLDAWADDYRRRGWPSDTPEYLLRGYCQMLVGQSDVDRMIRFATDHLRHGRMLDVSGGDAAALAEIAAAQDVLVAVDVIDLKAMACLAMHRDYLTDRNVDIPVDLPAVWASLGQPSRAEALSKSISDPWLRCSAFLGVTRAMADAGNYPMAEASVNQAMAIIGMAEEEQRREAVATAIDTMVAIGRPDWAAAFVEVADDPCADLSLQRARAVYADSETLAAYLETVVPIDLRAAELSQLVETVLERVGPGHGVPTITPTIMTEWITERGLPAAAKVQLATAVKRLIAGRRPSDSLVASDADDEVLATVALAACTAGYIDAAALLARLIENPACRVNAVTSLVTACAAVGDFDGAQSLLSLCGDSEYRAEATMSLAAIFAASGATDRAIDLMMQRQFLIEEVRGEDGYTELKSKAAQAWAALGDFEQAERVARSISGANELARVFTALASTLITKGDFDAARAFATDAEIFARMSVTTTTKVQGFTALAKAFAAAGDIDLAEATAGIAVLPDGEPSALEHLARTLLVLGQGQRATRIAHRFSPLVRDRVLVDLVTSVVSADGLMWAESVARSVSTGPIRMRALAHCARVAATCGKFDRAVSIALVIPDLVVQTEVVNFLLRKLAVKGDLERIRVVAEWASSRFADDVAPGRRYYAGQILCVALTASGDFEAANQVVDAITESNDRDALIVSVIAMAALRHELKCVDYLFEQLSSASARERALDEMASAALATREPERADRLADRLTDPCLRDRVRIEVAATFAVCGRGDLARDVVNRIQDGEQRGWALAAVADAGVMLPELDSVHLIIRELADADARLELLLALVEVMAGAGHSTRAADLIRATPESELRGQAWAVLAENVRGDQARNAVAQSLRWGRWTTSLGTLARLDPGSLLDIQAEFFVLNPANTVEST